MKTPTKPKENTTNKDIESIRIFIGGLNPPNLTYKNILQQLQSTFKQFSFTIDDTNRSSSSSLSSINKSFIHLTVTSHNSNDAYVRIRKKFHNIIWKGCTIRVEKARACFLKQLELERNHNTVTNEKENEIVKKLPRMLKIRDTTTSSNFRTIKHVDFDLKPRVCNDYNQCITTKSNKLEGKKQRLRSNHYIFEDDNCIFTNDWNQSKCSSSVISTSSSDDSINDKDDDIDDKINKENKYNRSSSSSEEESDSDELGKTKLNENKSEYVWSSSDESDEDEQNDKIIKSNSKKKDVDCCIEKEEKSSQSEKFENNDDESSIDMNLDTDIQDNIRIYQQLYPNEDVTISTKNENKKENITASSMQRFDPTNMDSISQFELQPSIPNDIMKESSDIDDALDKAEEDEGDTDDEEIEEYNDKKEESKENQEEIIYEQSTLENIFKTAKENNASLFSFNQNDKDKKEQEFNFSFSFGGVEQDITVDSKNKVEISKLNDSSTTAAITIESKPSKDIPDNKLIEINNQKRKRYNPIPYTKQDLEPYLTEFFAYKCTEEEWKEERRTLTLDWKRKLKDVIKFDRNKKKKKG